QNAPPNENRNDDTDKAPPFDQPRRTHHEAQPCDWTDDIVHRHMLNAERSHPGPTTQSIANLALPGLAAVTSSTTQRRTSYPRLCNLVSRREKPQVQKKTEVQKTTNCGRDSSWCSIRSPTLKIPRWRLSLSMLDLGKT